MKTGVYPHAKSSSAKRFLLDLFAKEPFETLSLQVEGESEFMAEFEEACEKALCLFFLQTNWYNRGVERGNRTFKEEFYARHDLLSDSH